jgi:hypothetical protein
VHLITLGYQVRLSTGTGTGLIPAEDQDTVLDALAVVKPVHRAALSLEEWAGSGAAVSGGDQLVVAFLGELGPGDAAELARARPGATGGVAFLLETATWAGPTALAADRHAFRESARILSSGGWQVVVATAQDDFTDLWRQAGGRRYDLGEPVSASYAASGPARTEAAPESAAAGPDPAAHRNGQNGRPVR